MRFTKLLTVSGWALLLFVKSAWAVDQFEIQVYNSEINEIGVYSLETHVNYVASGLTQPDYAGQIPFNHLAHLTLEFARGMTEYWEAGFYFQSAFTFPLTYYFGGVKLRSKFSVPRRLSGNAQFAINFELSDVPSNFEDSQLAIEMRPIVGYTLDPFTVLFNPILGWSLSGPGASAVPEFEPALKLMWDTKHHFALGIEYYAGIGPLNSVATVSGQEHYLYGAFDLVDSGLEWNVGVGKGLTDASNDVVLKTIVGFTF